MKKENNKTKQSGPIDIKKIIIFFCIALLIFGLVLAGKSVYNLYINKGLSGGNKATINVSKEANKVTIKATHNTTIQKMEYNWNNSEIVEVAGNGTNTLETTTEVPAGNNILNIVVTDIDGKETREVREYAVDTTEPQVSIDKSDSGAKIKIIAKDNEELSVITYKWDNEEEIEIEIPQDSKAQVEHEIDIPSGQHTLTVVAVNSKNKQKTATKEVKGIVKPNVTIVEDPEDSSYVILTATDEVSLMKEMRFWINGNGYKVIETQENGTKIQWRFQVQAGENQIKLTGINNEDVEETMEVIYTYNP